jgi:predicted Fe-Mo cluster-binding NifX family protein
VSISAGLRHHDAEYDGAAAARLDEEEWEAARDTAAREPGLIRLSEEERPMVVCVPVMADGQIDPRWGRAARVAIVDVEDGAVAGWREFDVGWDDLHDVGTEGAHHARVASFLREQGVQVVAAHHIGPAMVTMLGRMGLTVRLGASGDARQVALAAAASEIREGQPPAN